MSFDKGVTERRMAMNQSKKSRAKRSTRRRRFQNKQYRAEIARTLAGSPILKITPMEPEGRAGRHRKIAAFIYELAGELERRSEEVQARWVVTPEAMSARIILETVRDESALADQVLADLMADFNLA
jgi:hypothetical protein